ncbi:MAG: hypothetical protein IPL83_09375 [Bdellovibrionales bacterium]|jgi:hypothetical protein|nr:hypothetical protein [Bdellovibrionales bacterium]
MGEREELKTMRQNFQIRTCICAFFVLFAMGCNNSFIHSYKKPKAQVILQEVEDPPPQQGSNTNGDLKIVTGARTVAVLHSGQVLKNMMSIAGIDVPSTATVAMYDLKKTTFSENGRANSMNAPIVMALASVGGEVCNDLIVQEKAKPADDRRIYSQVNFGSGPANFSNAGRADSIRRLARSFWGRNETDAELQILQSALAEAVSAGGTAARDTEIVALYLCSAMIASLDAFTL